MREAESVVTDEPTAPGEPEGGDRAARADGDAISYVDALAELEQILDELDSDEVDVDVLGTRVRRAAELLRLCRDRIAGARLEVEQVVAELEADTGPEDAGAVPREAEAEGG